MYRSREVQDTGEIWAARAQLWFFDTFEALWASRNEEEHGNDRDMAWLIRLTKCDRAVRRLYDKGEDLPYAERHPFRDPMEDLLQQPVRCKNSGSTRQLLVYRKHFSDSARGHEANLL